MTIKICCYVDETGTDTNGALFIVGTVVTVEEPETLRAALERIEKESGKNRHKWIKAENTRREAYIRKLIDEPLFRNCLFYSSFEDSTAYISLTRKAVAAAILACAGDDHRVTVYVDALQKTQIDQFRVGLSRLGISVRKVRGVRDEESDALMRLADALAGFVRAARDGKAPYAELYKRAVEEGVLRHVG